MQYKKSFIAKESLLPALEAGEEGEGEGGPVEELAAAAEDAADALDGLERGADVPVVLLEHLPLRLSVLPEGIDGSLELLGILYVRVLRHRQSRFQSRRIHL